MPSLDSSPSSELYPSSENSVTTREHIIHAVNKVLDDQVQFSIEGDTNDNEDHILHYVQDVPTLWLVYMKFVDATREGDGERIPVCWKYLLVLFKAIGCTNYVRY